MTIVGCSAEEPVASGGASAAGGATTTSPEAGSMPEGNSPLVGEKAPEFTLTSNKGQEVVLADALKEGPVVMVFYRGHWCPFCQTQLADFKKGESEFSGAGAQVFLISVEGADDLSTMQNRHSMTSDTFTFLSDMDKTVGNQYGGFSEDGAVHNPAVYVIDQEGTVRYGFSESDYKVRAAFTDVLAVVKKI